MKTTLNGKSILVARLFASDDPTRPSICGVNIKIIDAETAIVEATDGKTLFRHLLPVKTEGFEEPISFIFGSKDILKSAKELKHKDGVFLHINKNSEGNLIIQMEGVGEYSLASYKALPERYPNTGKVIPVELQSCVNPKFDFAFGERITAIRKMLSEKLIKGSLPMPLGPYPVLFSGKGESGREPIVMLPAVDEGEVIVVMMPMSGGGESVKIPSVPAWAKKH